MDDWKYKIVEIAEDMAGEDGLDYSELSDKDQLKYYGKAYEYYLDRPEKANGGIMRNFYAQGDEVEEFQEDDLSEIELMKDQGVPYGEQVKAQDSGIMQMAEVKSKQRSFVRRRISKIQIRYVRTRFRPYGL